MTLFSFLHIDDSADDETATTALTAIITAAVHDPNPAIPLSEIYHQVAQNNGAAYLDALHVLPGLLQSSDPTARDIISILGECGPAKEVAIAAQEALERLRPRLDGDDEDPPVQTLLELIGLYTNVIPRIKLRKKSALDTVKPYIGEIQEVIQLASHLLSTEQSRELLLSTSLFVERVYGWIESRDTSTSDAKVALKKLLFCSLSASAPRLDAALAQRTFEELYPRLVVRAPQAPVEKADESIAAAWSALRLLGQAQSDVAKDPSQPSIVLLAHLNLAELVQIDLSSIRPVFIASIQSNLIIDHTLALLLKILHQRKGELSPEILIPLTTVLPTLASGHPDAQTRHQVFRILGLLLSRSPPPLRLQILQDLTSNSEFPQMRVAAVGLVKEAVLEALSSEHPRNNIFASSAFLRTFGPILFQPRPADVFDSSLSVKEFDETQEPKRLVECLSLYYILLVRDEQNLTGIRDKDVTRSIEHNLLNPLRKQLDAWSAQPGVSEGHIHDLMPVVSLQMSLDRVDSAKKQLFE
ncbi:hypothetical protein CC1G_10975 [Coprinopsis cinerea okayama7|uniref:Uncharacterized protein n=1 Tax=Coprinopsis cinerea (strain Okayama-7 / 130 / ATCC MYA-4618 / FGSC 9003) TaxID=240176 RepID=A8PC22_COPC7|nr:hypothetical protein CC1G_10975 [Coprinopsis cinerea okayama7\|eukprot:XP_001840312.1 hypothetical protein CC1G_10975 [Coprinopsis cinerea okayama7\